ncbi:response regulator [Rubricella aquisinus]|uniref:response regulator transcription factor n=1 Tax=Rubricella aquisinus TaxID=2028108 RepID=UPI0031B59047
MLIVEDEANIVESLIFLLERDGFEVATVADGAAALDRIAAFNPDVVLLDVMLPSLSGFDILNQLRGSDAHADMPVMMLTAKGQSKDRDRAMELGATVFVTKPFSNAEIVAHVRQMVGQEKADGG